MHASNSRRGYFRTALLGAALVVGAVSTSHAQRRVFEWSGKVDPDVELTIAGGGFVATRIASDQRTAQGSSNLHSLPSQDGQLTVKVLEGSGSAEIAQQPMSQNAYTGVIRVRNMNSGSDAYRIEAFWEPSAGGDVPFTKPPFDTSAMTAAGDVVRDFTSAPSSGMPDTTAILRDASSRVALIWTGDVDNELEITLRPGAVSYNTIRGAEPRSLQSAVREMPPAGSTLVFNQMEGRGEVVILQQPTAENDFTAKIRIRDPQRGFGHYSFLVGWQ